MLKEKIYMLKKSAIYNFRINIKHRDYFGNTCFQWDFMVCVSEMFGFKAKLTDDDYQELEKLIDCFDGQNFITAMGFCCVKVSDVEKIVGVF